MPSGAAMSMPSWKLEPRGPNPELIVPFTGQRNVSNPGSGKTGAAGAGSAGVIVSTGVDGSPRYKNPLADLDLPGVLDSVNAGQFLVGHTVGFADQKQSLPGCNHVVGPLRPRFRNRCL